MPALADIQLAFRNALITSDAASAQFYLSGGPDPDKAIAIHRRNYEVNLVAALMTRFPATVWLAGSPLVTEAAKRFISVHPPHKPCIAEYGDDFPQFLAVFPGTDRMPYLRDFAEVEWQLGRLSVETDELSLAAKDLSRIDPGRLPDMKLRLQRGLRYHEASWPIDELLRVYLTETAPDRYVLEPCGVRLEVRGARGEFKIDRLSSSEFVFRRTIWEGHSIETAAERAFDADADFEPGIVLLKLFSDGLVTLIE